MLQGLREESILEPLNLACLKPLHYFEYPVILFASAQSAAPTVIITCLSAVRSIQHAVEPDLKLGLDDRQKNGKRINQINQINGDK